MRSWRGWGNEASSVRLVKALDAASVSLRRIEVERVALNALSIAVRVYS
jgi:hypothetical protein